jgi:hypothetical protein
MPPPILTPNFPGAVSQDLYNLTNIFPGQTAPTLASPITSTALSATLSADPGGLLPTAYFLISIDSEILLVSARAGATLTIATRGYDGTTAAAHAAAASVNAFPVGHHMNRLAAEIYAIENSLGTNLSALYPGQLGDLQRNPPDLANNYTPWPGNKSGFVISHTPGKKETFTIAAVGPGPFFDAWYTALPAAPYTIIYAVSPSIGANITGTDFTLFLADTTITNAIMLRQTAVSPDWRWGVTTTQPSGTNWNNASSDITTQTSGCGIGTPTILLMSIQDDNTNWNFRYSMDAGNTWWLFYSKPRNSGFTAANYGIEFQLQASYPTSATIWTLYTTQP